MLGWIFGGLVVALVAAYVVSRLGTYRRLLSDAHFVEIARAATPLKAAAIEKLIVTDRDYPASPRDPRFLLTSAGLAVIYTVRKHESAFIHHCSVSVAGGYTAHAVGTRFIAFVAQLLELPIEKAAFEIGSSTVHHAEATLDQAEHAKLAGSPVPEVSEANVAEVRRATDETRFRMEWKRAPPSDARQLRAGPA